MRAEERRGIEIAQQLSATELIVDRLGPAARGDAPATRKLFQHLSNAFHRPQFPVEQLTRASADARFQHIRQHTTPFSFEGGIHILRAAADEALGDLVDRQSEAELDKHLGYRTARDHLAIDQHAIAIEDDEIEFLARSHVRAAQLASIGTPGSNFEVRMARAVLTWLTFGAAVSWVVRKR